MVSKKSNKGLCYYYLLLFCVNSRERLYAIITQLCERPHQSLLMMLIPSHSPAVLHSCVFPNLTILTIRPYIIGDIHRPHRVKLELATVIRYGLSY